MCLSTLLNWGRGSWNIPAARHQFFGQPEEVSVWGIWELFDFFGLPRGLENFGWGLWRCSGQIARLSSRCFDRAGGRRRNRWVNAGISRTGSQACSQQEKS